MRYWQVNRHFLKVLKVVASIAAALFLLLYLLPLGLFRIPSIQREAASRVATLLTEVFDSPVQLERVELLSWTNIEAHRVIVLDTTGKQMLSASRLIGGISLSDLITQQEVRITSARLFEANLHLIRDPRTGRLNIQHTIDHLSKPKGTSKSLPVDINSIIIRDMRLSLSEAGRDQLVISKLSTRIRRLRFSKDYIGGAIDELSFTTDKDFTLSSLTGQGELQGSRLTLSNLQIELPKSSLSIPLARIETKRHGLGLIEELEVGDTKISLSDLSILSPALRNRQEQASLQATYCHEEQGAGRANFSLRLPRQLILEGSGHLTWDSTGRVTSLTTDISDAQLSAELLSLVRPHLPPSTLPLMDRLSRLQSLRHAGQTQILFGKSFSGKGYITSAQGRWDYDLSGEMEGEDLRHIEGKASTQGFDLKPLLGDLAPIGAIASSIEVDATNSSGQLDDWQGNLQVNLPTFTYQGQTLRGSQLAINTIGSHRHKVHFEVEDPAASLALDGAATVSGRALHAVEANLQVHHLQTDLFGLTPTASRQKLTLAGRLSMDELNIDRGQGRLSIDHISLSSPQRTLALDELSLLFSGNPEEARMIYLRSPYLTASLRGHYVLSALVPDLRRTLYHHFPSLDLAHTEGGQHSVHTSGSDFDLSLQLHRIPEEWQQALQLPITLEEGAEVRASYIGATHALSLQASVPNLRLRGHELRGAALSLEGNELKFTSDARLANGTEVQGIGLQTQLATDSLHLQLNLGREVKSKLHNGLLNIGASIQQYTTQANGRPALGFEATLDPSTIRVHSDTWAVAPARLSYRDKELRIAGLDLASSERRISISGALSPDPKDHLNIALKKINLLYILESVGVGFNMLDTDLTGSGTASIQGGKVVASAAVTTPAFHVKGVNVGALKADLAFDSGDGRILLEGDVTQSEGGHSHVQGYIRPSGGAGIDLTFTAERLRTDFVGKFMDTLFDHVRGEATGRVRLFGLFEDGVTIEGDADIQEGNIGVRLLGTSYSFSHRLSFTPTSIIFSDITMHDDEGHTGRLNGVIRHRFFDHFDLDLTASELQRMKVLQTATKQSLPIYGTAYGTGTALLKGKLPKLLLDVNMRSAAGTDVVLDFNKTDVRKDERFFTYRPLRPLSSRDSLALADSLSHSTPEAETELTMRMALQVTPDARLSLRLGNSQSLQNDIVTRCDGDLTIEVPHSGAPTVYGGLTLREGQYTFNFEQLARKRFTLKEGGRLDFRGDPMAALIDLKAAYDLTANIADIDAGLSTLAQRTSIPVSCTIRLGGVITRPDITLGVELPSSEPEVERRLQSLLTSEDERNRQFLYLMTLGKFYTTETKQGTTTVSNDLTSLATTTLSDQLSRLLGNFSSDIQIGANIRTASSAIDNTDIELLFSGSWLDDRLLINGNVGYYDNPFLAGKYIGEFDLEYKLNKSGTLRLKGYSHYNSMYQYVRQSLTTQGLGFMFQRRFDSLSDLFARWRRKPKMDSTTHLPQPDSLHK